MRVRRRKPPRERFRALLGERRRLVEARSRAHEEARHELADRLRAYGPKGWANLGDLEVTQKALAKLEDWEIALLRAPILDRFEAFWDRARADLNWAEHRLEVLARVVPPERGEEWREYRTVRGSDYHTQGYGADSYARGKADLAAFEIQEKDGIPARVVKVARPLPEHRSWHYVHTSDFRVEVQAREDIDLELIRRRPGLTLREFVKGCWRRGLNPRVYNPFLPHGLEERLGVDYQGRDVETQKAVP